MDYDRFRNMDECKSEVARLRYQIEQEYQAAALGINGFAAGVSRHDFINAKMDRVGEYRQELAQLIGDLEATRICAEVADNTEMPDSTAPIPSPAESQR